MLSSLLQNEFFKWFVVGSCLGIGLLIFFKISPGEPSIPYEKRAILLQEETNEDLARVFGNRESEKMQIVAEEFNVSSQKKKKKKKKKKKEETLDRNKTKNVKDSPHIFDEEERKKKEEKLADARRRKERLLKKLEQTVADAAASSDDDVEKDEKTCKDKVVNDSSTKKLGPEEELRAAEMRAKEREKEVFASVDRMLAAAKTSENYERFKSLFGLTDEKIELAIDMAKRGERVPKSRANLFVEFLDKFVYISLLCLIFYFLWRDYNFNVFRWLSKIFPTEAAVLAEGSQNLQKHFLPFRRMLSELFYPQRSTVLGDFEEEL